MNKLNTNLITKSIDGFIQKSLWIGVPTSSSFPVLKGNVRITKIHRFGFYPLVGRLTALMLFNFPFRIKMFKTPLAGKHDKIRL